MFAYTSLTAERMTKLAKEHSIKDEIENYDASPVLADD